MLGEPVPAPLAVQWGLANRAVPDDQLDEEALALARRLATGPTKAYAAAKREFNAWSYSSLRGQLALEADEQQRLARPTTTPRASPRSWRSARRASSAADRYGLGPCADCLLEVRRARCVRGARAP